MESVWKIVWDKFLVVFLGGGLSMIFENPIGNYLKNKIVSDRYVIERFNQLESYHASTAVSMVKTDGTLTNVTLRGVSTRANEFFGKRPESKELIGKTGEDLMKMIGNWMDSADYDAFKNDQQRVLEEYSADQDAFANVPVVFNSTHPKHPDGIFLPVIVSLVPVEKKNSGKSEQWIQIDYLDVNRFIPVVDKYRQRRGSGPPTSPHPQ